MQDNDFDHDQLDDDFISKSQRKREAQALTELGQRIVALSPKDLAGMPLDGELLRAVTEARKMRSHGARKRQLLYIGKLLRNIDSTEIEAAFTRLEQRSQREAAHFHRLEQWRDRLLAEGDSALGDLLDEHPDADRNHLRRLVREARREASSDKPPRSARELFKALRELFGKA